MAHASGFTSRTIRTPADSLSLADTLAKSIFGDPEGQMKARALASEVGVRMASRDKLLADAGLINAKTTAEQNAEAERCALARRSARREPPPSRCLCRSKRHAPMRRARLAMARNRDRQPARTGCP